MTVIDNLNQAWSGLLDFLSKLVIPDWGALIGLLPVFLVIGVLGPIVSIIALAWFVYVVRRPHSPLRYQDGPRPAPLDADGHPAFPAGLPHCPDDGLVYDSGATRCERDGRELWVICPMCKLGRAAAIQTCAECGLVLKVEKRAIAAGTIAGPPPGGAAVA